MSDRFVVPERRRALVLATAALLALAIYCLISLGGGGGGPQQAGAQVSGTSTSYLKLLDENGAIIDGGSLDRAHRREIELRSWGFGIQNAQSFGTTSGAGTGKAQPQPLTFTHGPNPSWPRLFSASARGAKLNEAVLTVTRTSTDGTTVDYLVYSLKPVFVTKLADSASGGAPAQEVTLVYGSATVSFRPTAAAQPIGGGWDFITNTPTP